MRRIEKDIANVPDILKSGSVRLAFDENIAQKRYCDKKDSYRSAITLEALNKIYHKKCAYCEKSLLDDPKHIEHYRPKKIYYWLAYSWDNLLLACGSCNSAKGDRFAVNDKNEYRDETFESIHALGKRYDEIEKPLVVNPEASDLSALITYDKNGIVDSKDIRVKHTIEKACKLNRAELIQLRQTVINDFVNQINYCYILFKSKKSDLTIFEPTIQTFLKKCVETEEFYTLRLFIVNNIDVFFENEGIRKILRYFVTKASSI